MLFLPLEEQGQQTTALKINSPPENTQKQANSGSFQLLHWASALNVNCSTLYLRWMSTVMKATCAGRVWPSGTVIPQGVKCLGSFQSDTWIREFTLWWVRGSRSPSGLKNWRITEVGEETSQLHAKLKLTHPFSKTPIYRALSWGLRRGESCECKEVLLVWV